MKKFKIFSVVLALIASACGGSNETQEASSDSTTTSSTTTTLAVEPDIGEVVDEAALVIPPILLNRLTVIRMKGYDNQDKLHIIKYFIIPKIIQNVGINSDDIIFTDQSILYILNTLDREPGMRLCKQKIEYIVSNINLLRLNISKNIKVKFKIKNLKLPIKVDKNLVQELW